MNRLVAGHQVHAEPADGLAGYLRVYADGTFCGLVCHDPAGWHTVPASHVGTPAPPTCWCPTCAVALFTLVTEAFRG